jgi:aconitate hydratase
VGDRPIAGARCSAMVGDSVTTDHISPAGNIKADSPAGKYLRRTASAEGLQQYGARRGNDRVMTRGTFANIRCATCWRRAPRAASRATCPAATRDGDLRRRDEVRSRKHAARGARRQGVRHRQQRDWAAKGTMLLGVKA